MPINARILVAMVALMTAVVAIAASQPNRGKDHQVETGSLQRAPSSSAAHDGLSSVRATPARRIILFLPQ